ncbi:hypothetical protein ACQKIL_13510, partial [Staphylococcus aureus]
PKGVKSGLKEAVSRLHNVKGISILKLDQSDVSSYILKINLKLLIYYV